ncbi:MAG: discoidin domain-containing protein, partial [Chitinispirillaceae bacterium]|nr:discoidin domain-containing protein [Chitinispirillaceae bacterium]
KAFPYEVIRGLIKRLQPNCLILDHNGATPWEVDIEYFEEPLGVTAPAGNTYPSCQGQTISGDWFWNSSAADISQLKTLSDIVSHLTTLEPRYCNFVLNCPPNRTGIFDNAIVTRLGQIGPAWSPNNSRAAMPTPPPQLDRPFTPVSATATSAASSAFNAIDNTNDFSGSSHTQTLWTSTSALPQSVTLDLGVVRDSIDMLMYQPRRFGSTTGNITSYRIYMSTNGTTFTQITAGTSSSGIWGTWPGDSTIKWARFAQQNARYVRLEAAAANGSASNMINNNDSRITYTGWYYSGGRGLGDYNDDGHFSTVIGDSCVFTFNGTGIDYLSERYSDMGNVDVYIDGTFRQNVNLYVSGSRQVQQAVYSITTLSAGSHRIKIVNRSTAYACVDAFRLYGADTSAPAVINTIAVGAFLPYSQAVGIAAPQPASSSAPLPQKISIMKAVRRVNFDPALAGAMKSVAVYDLSGKLAGVKNIRKNSVDLRKDFGVSEGVYVVKVFKVK